MIKKMATWIKWWKDKTIMSVILIALFTVIVGFVLSYFITWGWIPTIILAIVDGKIIKRIIDDRISEILDNRL